MPARTTSGSPDYPATTEAELERKGATHPVKPLTTLVGLVPFLASRFQWTGAAPPHPPRTEPLGQPLVGFALMHVSLPDIMLPRSPGTMLV